jgi:uncharacterized protein (TIGR02284 family)
MRDSGEQDFRDFSCLLPAQENRAQPADPGQRGIEEAIMANELDGSNRNQEMERVLLDVIQTLHDGQKGFAEFGERMKDEPIKRYFLAESLKRANFRAELENELHRAGMADVKESGTLSGTLHRSWGDLKAAFGGDEHSLLVTAEQGEDAARKAYKDALDEELPLPVRQLLTEQQSHILTSHEFVRSHRDALVAK